tara:strand:+ start:831 stop:1043 length:213 start_codon:yes stop_codon:yes gene_type:complete
LRNNCSACGLHEKGICNWFEEPRTIPVKVIKKGCKYWRSELAQVVIDKYEGEVLYGRYNKIGRFRTKERR